MNDLNQIQMQIISTLSFKESARFSELNIAEVTNDHFNYHLKKLITDGLVEKTNEGKYKLSEEGKKFVTVTDIFNNKIEKQGKIGMIPVCVKEEDGVKKYLIHTRKRHPYFDWSGFPSGKAKFGFLFEDEVNRELEEETGLSGKPELKIITHYLVYRKGTDELLEDKTFFIYKITDLTGTLVEKAKEGENQWLTLEEIKKITQIFDDNVWIIENLDSDKILYVEGRKEMDSF